MVSSRKAPATEFNSRDDPSPLCLRSQGQWPRPLAQPKVNICHLSFSPSNHHHHHHHPSIPYFIVHLVKILYVHKNVIFIFIIIIIIFIIFIIHHEDRLAKGMGAAIEERQLQGIHGLLPPRLDQHLSIYCHVISTSHPVQGIHDLCQINILPKLSSPSPQMSFSPPSIICSSVKSQAEQADLCLRQVRAIPEPLDRYHQNSLCIW